MARRGETRSRRCTTAKPTAPDRAWPFAVAVGFRSVPGGTRLVMVERMIEVGQFTVESTSLMVSDPCYGHGTWCQGILEGVRPGQWLAEIKRVERKGWGVRIASLSVRHTEAGALPAAGNWEAASFEVGVDSGQAGFWDLPRFPDKNDKGDYGDPTSWYGSACETTLNGPCAGVMLGGAVASSGYGDGVYQCTFARAASGDIVAAKITFIGDYEDEAL